MKKLSVLLFAAMAALTLSACKGNETEVQGYYVSIDINPSIEFVVDGDDIVESYIFLNEDAEILCADLDFVGMNIDDAVELFVQTATEAGYIDPEGEENAVLITVLGEDGEEENLDRIRTRIHERLHKHFIRNYINAEVLSEDFTQEDLVLQAEELGVSPGKLKLALVAQVADETLVLEELLEMPVKDILAMVRELHGEEFAEYKEERKAEFQERKQERIDQYKERFQNYLDEHPELTEEEIQALIEEAREQFRNETRERWQERKEEWKNRQDQEECEEDCTNV